MFDISLNLIHASSELDKGQMESPAFSTHLRLRVGALN